MFELDAAKRGQDNLNGLIKIIPGDISQSKQTTGDVLPGKAMNLKLQRKKERSHGHNSAV